ncbi:MAG: CDP-alcohol phosphatidyltransferase family protein [Myxococcota bacterium]
MSATARHGPPGPFVLNLPNAFTASRLVLVAPFAWLLFTGAPRWTLVATFAFAAATDLFDGQLARRLGQVTPGGAWLDQMVDRVFTVAIVAVVLVHDLGFAAVPAGSPDPARPVQLLLACTREAVGSIGVAIALARGVPLYFVEPIGKLTTFVQSTAIAVILLGPAFASWLAIACGVVGAFSGASYVRHALRATPAGAPGTTGRSDA